MHTPSTPEVQAPASATDPRYSTSGVLNAQIKEKNRQGLLSTLGGRTGRVLDVNKFADIKTEMRDPRAVPVLEQLSKLYADVSEKSKAGGVVNTTHSEVKSQKNVAAYNESVNAVNNYLKQHNVKSGNAVAAGGTHDFDGRELFHDEDYAARNRDDIKKSVSNMGKTGKTFNELEAQVKKKTAVKK